IMSSSQVGKTELLLNIIGRFMHLDPCSILLIFPTSSFGKAFSHERLGPMIRDTEVLRKIIMIDNNDTIMRKKFPGGFVTIVGAQSPTELSGRPIRIVLMDEVDRFPQSAGTEGSPIDLADRRTQNFHNKKSIRVSTPTLDGISLIQGEYKNSSQEEWALECPHCKEYQVLVWDNLKWSDKNSKTVKLLCNHCGVLSTEKQWKGDKQKGKWISKFPERKEHRGFAMNALASPWVKWSEIVEEFYASKDDPNRLQTFYNTVLGLPWKTNTSEIKDFMKLYNSRIDYEAELHKDIKYLTCGVDVQANRLELEIVGWGLGQRSYGVMYTVIQGSPGEQSTWDKLYKILKRDFYFKNKKDTLKIAITLIDSGHATNEVYNFVHGKEEENIFAIKGIGGEGKNPINGFNTVHKEGCLPINLLSLGVNALKDTLYFRLDLEEGAGQCFFPLENGYSVDYFKGLTAEVKKLQKTNKGKKLSWEIIPGRKRNEPLDIRNYNTAGMLFIENTEQLLREEREDV
ncbi:MAG: phage terminase large subunit family protein, partial [Fusobacteriaceae bacterium]